ncbi:MAG: large conductance mechanosensitive channel protein MscL [Ruminococcaceae bacterium]|nr:large conductance mechanosensitive channel protein MscL [Oscillospiraceae bacterium]
MKKKGLIAEFKEFIMRGNVIDMAIGVIIAGAFGKITTSLVNDVFMPFLGWIIGDFDMTQLNLTLVEEVKNAAGEITTPAVVIGFGSLISTVIDFLLIALIIFIIIKVFNTARELTENKLLHKKEEEEAPVEEVKAPTAEELLSEILAEIKKSNE